MPAQAADHAGSLLDEVLAVIDQQAHLAVSPVEASDRQVGLPERRAGDRERVDRVGLAGRTSRVARVGHQLRRHPEDSLAGSE